jgi:hypothetical protein
MLGKAIKDFAGAPAPSMKGTVLRFKQGNYIVQLTSGRTITAEPTSGLSPAVGDVVLVVLGSQSSIVGLLSKSAATKRVEV